MAHIVVIGAGLGGLPTAYELRHRLPHHHRITLRSDTPQFTFLPSLPWVALGLTTLESIQVTGILFLADPVLPAPATGKRRRAIALQGAWVGWAKTAFEQYFLAKMRLGAAVPWFERLALRGVGLSLVEPTSASLSTDCLHGNLG